MKPRFQKVGKKEGLEDGEKDEKLDKNDDPKFSTDGHAFEAIEVKVKDPFEKGTMQ